jgi:uncharacterized protein YutE (UPF0331/DUF86 family)
VSSVEQLDQTTDLEPAIMRRLRREYEEQGYSVVVNPQAHLVPDFLRHLQPDAIATKPGENIVIEIKTTRNALTDQKLSEIRRAITGHANWKLNVVYAPARQEDSIVISSAPIEVVRQGIDEVKDLIESGHNRAAFMLSWSVLEAALHHVSGEPASHLRTPGQVVQSLAIAGKIDHDVAQSLKNLSELRNRIVHGDLQANVSREDVNQVLAGLEEALVSAPQ